MFDEARLGMSAVSLRIERIHHWNEKTSRISQSNDVEFKLFNMVE